MEKRGSVKALGSGRWYHTEKRGWRHGWRISLETRLGFPCDTRVGGFGSDGFGFGSDGFGWRHARIGRVSDGWRQASRRFKRRRRSETGVWSFDGCGGRLGIDWVSRRPARTRKGKTGAASGSRRSERRLGFTEAGVGWVRRRRRRRFEQ